MMFITKIFNTRHVSKKKQYVRDGLAMSLDRILFSIPLLLIFMHAIASIK
jgi:hypothetical protein